MIDGRVEAGGALPDHHVVLGHCGVILTNGGADARRGLRNFFTLDWEEFQDRTRTFVPAFE